MKMTAEKAARVARSVRLVGFLLMMWGAFMLWLHLFVIADGMTADDRVKDDPMLVTGATTLIVLGLSAVASMSSALNRGSQARAISYAAMAMAMAYGAVAYLFFVITYSSGAPTAGVLVGATLAGLMLLVWWLLCTKARKHVDRIAEALHDRSVTHAHTDE